jgi:hypothetical protein
VELLKCNDCEKDISRSTKLCPNCGCSKPFSGQSLSASQSKNMSVKERRSFQKAGGKLTLSKMQKFGMFVLFCFALLAVKTCNAPLPPEEQIKSDRAELENSARHTCQYFIEKNLNDPDSVEYDRELLDRIVVEETPTNWSVQLKLRAKNKFNALVPAKFMCKLSYNGKDFSLLSINEVK